MFRGSQTWHNHLPYPYWRDRAENYLTNGSQVSPWRKLLRVFLERVSEACAHCGGPECQSVPIETHLEELDMFQNFTMRVMYPLVLSRLLELFE